MGLENGEDACRARARTVVESEGHGLSATGNRGSVELGPRAGTGQYETEADNVAGFERWMHRDSRGRSGNGLLLYSSL